uniref:SpoIID/LytB domain-containing protein n=1 Tax=uncultured organism TaxID=155900 RepID=M1QBY8_9ZZZZ|nr:SpoIID/LytB domain-containing protein [uncultured organism]
MYLRKIILVAILLLMFSICLLGCENWSRVKGIKERGKLEEEPTLRVKMGDGSIRKLKLEEYITGVVAGEMKNNWPIDAYGAQAIIARTFALEFLEENDTDTISGEFEYAQEYKPEAVTPEIRKGISNTRGEVVLYKDEYIKGWFHASAGGQTTSAKVGLAYEKAEPPYIKSVKSPDHLAPSDVKNWSVYLGNKEIEEALKKMGKNIGELLEINYGRKDKTGRIINLEFEGSTGSATVKAANFRKQLDPKKLKSIKIDSIEKMENGFQFKGSGFGHGVGLSQWGAYAFAEDNKSPEEIVKYYFNNVDIVKVYD